MKKTSKKYHFSIAVIINTKNRPQKLMSVLFDLKKQTHLPDHIILIEDIGTQKNFSQKKLSDLFKSIKCTYQAVKFDNLSKSRNAALKFAKEDLIIFIDDDVAFKKDVIKKIYTKARNAKSFEALVFKIFPYKNNKWGVFSSILHNQSIHCPNEQYQIPCFPFTFVAIKNTVKNSKIHFDETLFSGEDIDYMLNINAPQYYNIEIIEGISVKHHFDSTLSSVFKKQYSYASAAAQLNQKHPLLYPISEYFPERKIHFIFLPFFVILRSDFLAKGFCKRLHCEKLYFQSLIKEVAWFLGIYFSPAGRRMLIQKLKFVFLR